MFFQTQDNHFPKTYNDNNQPSQHNRSQYDPWEIDPHTTLMDLQTKIIFSHKLWLKAANEIFKR